MEKTKKEKDKKNQISQEYIARMRATNTILEQHKKIKIIQFLNIADNSLHPNCSVDIDEPIFKPEPNVILFTDYEPLQIKSQVLKLRNRDIVPRRVQIITPETRLFQVIPMKKGAKNKKNKDEESEAQNVEIMNTMVAPGMEVSYQIRFTPEAKVDVNYDLIVITEREKFIVPIRGIGCKVMLEFMDFIDFGEVPVKYRIEKPIILRNVGEKITKWMLKINSPNLSVSKKEGILDIGKSEQIICNFCPLEAKYYKEEMTLNYDEFEAKIKIVGKSKNDQVRLSCNSKKLDDAYITLHSQAFIDIINKSTVPIDFVWKQYMSKEKEDEAKQKVFDNLNRQEAEEKILNELAYDYEEIQGDRSFDIDDSYDEEELIKISERNHLKNLNVIARRFEKIKKSLNEDQMYFDDPNFQIEPLSGKIWPSSSISICITFKPELAKSYFAQAFCDVTGLDKRLKLDLTGVGIGPKAKLSFYEKNLLDIFITEEKFIEKDLVITNIGVIPCDFEIESPNTPCAKQFTFHVDRGTLKSRSDKDNGEMVIPFTFKAKRLGEFTEKFKIHIPKAGKNLDLVFKGHVVAPTCQFDKESINFEKVSPGFPNKREFEIKNLSRVDIKYELRISSDFQDQEMMKSCFILEPNQGVLTPDVPQKITIEFTPDEERTYEIVVLMDMTDIGYDMLTLPVTAVCEIPEVKIEPTENLDFGEIFIRDEKTKIIKLTNLSNSLCAKFKVEEQEPATKSYGIFEVNCPSETIEKGQTYDLEVRLKPNKTGSIRIPLRINCKSKNTNSGNNYHNIYLVALSKGPEVLIINPTTPVFDFGEPEVLKEDKRKIQLRNNSTIEAKFTAFMRENPSIFNVNPKKGIIQKGDVLDLEICCRPDEAMTFEEKLFIKIDEGEDRELFLKCKGRGLTVMCENLSLINFGVLFTNSTMKKEIWIKNRGRKNQKIVWTRHKNNNKKNLEDKNAKQNNNKKPTEEEEEIAFEVYPDKMLIPSRKKGCFTITAMFKKPNPRKEERFNVNYYAEQGGNSGIPLGQSIIVGEFITPYVTWIPEKLIFPYNYERDFDKSYIEKELEITNRAKLDAVFDIQCSHPIEFNENTLYTLKPEQSKKFLFKFNTSDCRASKESDMLDLNVKIVHRNHEQTDPVQCTANIQFPNISLSRNLVDFGCLLEDTFKREKLTIENKSEMKVKYEFFLLEDPNSYDVVNKKKKAGRKIPLNEVFSIVPMNGELNKGGDKEDVEITFLPGTNQKYLAKLKCSVVGGPDKFIDLIGSASEIHYQLNVTNANGDINDNYDMNIREFDINLGEVLFSERAFVDITIKNDGEVAFFYKILYNSSKIRYVSLSSTDDKIEKADSKKIRVEIITGVPDILRDYIIIEIAHCEPIKVNIKALGVYRGAIVGLKRKDPDYENSVKNISKILPERKTMVQNFLPPPKKGIPIPKKVPQSGINVNNLKCVPDLNNEIEIEFNRRYICEKLASKIEKNEVSNIANLAKSDIKGKPLPSSTEAKEEIIKGFMKEFKIGSYECDFGNIVAGEKESRSIEIFNFNKNPITIFIDKKELSNYGYQLPSISSDKNIIDGQSVLRLTIDHETKKNITERKVTKMKIFINSLNNEHIEVELISNICIPDFEFMDKMVDSVDFGRVYIGRKKIVRFRIQNTSKVVGSWKIMQHQSKEPAINKKDGADKKDEIEAFNIWPLSGQLDPNKKATITVSFVPSRIKSYISKLFLWIEKSSVQKDFNLKGLGSDLVLDIIPVNLNIGPFFPHYKYAFGSFELKNNNDIDIEVYSLDFDNKFQIEEEIIRNYKVFLKNPNAQIDMPIRQAGQPIWEKFEKFYSKLKDKADKLKIDLANVNDYLGILLADEEENDEEIKFPQPLLPQNKVNVILIGPEKTGKTSLAKDQQKHHFRGIVNVEEIFEWNERNGFSSTIEKARFYLEEKKKELEIVKQERAKQEKANKNKKPKVELPPLDERKYSCLSKEIMLELFTNRLSYFDCGAGVVFDSFTNKYVENEETLIEIVDELLANEHIILCTLEYSKDHMGLEVCEIINWAKYQEEYRDKIMGGTKFSTDQTKLSETNKKFRMDNKKGTKRDNRKNKTGKDSGLSGEENKFAQLDIPNLTFSDPLYHPDKSHYEQLKQRMIEKFLEIKELRNKIYEEQLRTNESINELSQIEQNSEVQIENKTSENFGENENREENNTVISKKLQNIYLAERNHKELFIQYHLKNFLNEYLRVINAPNLPDPEDLPLPPDEEYQIIKRPVENKSERVKSNYFFLKSVSQEFENLTLDEIKDLIIQEDKKLEEIKLKEALEAKDKNKSPKKPQQPNVKAKVDSKIEEVKPKEILIDQTRWIIKKKESMRVIVGFYSKEVGPPAPKNKHNLGFSILNYPTKEEVLSLTGISDYPKLSQLPVNIMSKTKPGVINSLNKKNLQVDFGFLLITKDLEKLDKTKYDKYKETNSKFLTFTNDGKFDLNVSFQFLSNLNADFINKDEKSPFYFMNDSLDIKQGESKSLLVYSFPQKTIEYKDELICLIKDNPLPIRVPLVCKGAEPKVEITPDTLEFDKLIVNTSCSKQIKLKNVSEVNCKWSINFLPPVLPQFKFDCTSGIVEKGKEAIINIEFFSEKEEKFSANIVIDVEDNLNYGVKQPSKNMKITAEAFKINVNIIYPNNDNLLDFGNIRVKDYKNIPLILKNLGIYKIRYKFEITSKLWKELFRFEPAEGEIDAAKDKTIMAIFLPYAKEVSLSQVKGTNIKLIIFEGDKDKKNQEPPIFVNVNTFFSKYIINPPKSINFGSLQYNDTLTRSIEIYNDGQFEFSYDVMEYHQDEAVMKKIKEERDQKEQEEQKLKEQEIKEALENVGKKPTQAKKPAANDKDKNKKKDDGSLKISSFIIPNPKGIVAPKTSVKIDITFKAEGKTNLQKTIAININGRQPEDNPLGIPYDLLAESCIPGIETKDFDMIFEEQTVLETLNPEFNKQTVITSNIYAIQEKVFWFGTIIPSKEPTGVEERIKLINPNKIACNVKVACKPRTTSKSEAFAFEIKEPSPIKIYPHESKYVTVIFKPTSVIPYSGIFEAIVEGGEPNPDTAALRFDLRGEGTLPSLVVDSPMDSDESGATLVKFKRTRVSKFSNSIIALRNDGTVSATVKFENIDNECFQFLSPSTATIQPKNYQSFEIKFEPKESKIEKGFIQYKVLHNPYETPKISLFGEGFIEALSFENLVNDNEINFGDLSVNERKKITFDLQNYSDTPYKFLWLNNIDNCFEIQPAFGIILPKQRKQLTATFCSTETLKFAMKDIYCQFYPIKFTSDQVDWDSSMKMTRKVSNSENMVIQKKKAEELAKRKEEIEVLISQISNTKNKADPKKAQAKDAKKGKEDEIKINPNEEANIDVEEIIPEPIYTVIEKNEKGEKADKTLFIKISAVSDFVRYDCPTKEVRFKTTSMYDSRQQKIQLKNLSTIAMNFNFEILNVATGVIDNGPYTVSPNSGSIPAGSDESIIIRFSPLEVDDLNYPRNLICHMKNLDPNQKPMQISLIGLTRRPVCHFELTGGVKREDVFRILEFDSIGMGVKNTKKFFVLNPTNLGYEFEWEEDEETNSNKIFKGITLKGVIYSGKKFEMVFEYTPVTLGNHESYWTFKIPSEKIFQKFKFIGIAREPLVLFNQGKVEFGSLLIDGRNKEIVQIINEEHIPFKYFIDKDSIKGKNTFENSLIVTPIAGTLHPKSSTPIEITFMPKVEKEFNYNLVVKIKQRQKPLVLNVKGTGYKITHSVYLDTKPDLKLIANKEHLIDFGEFYINEKRERTIYLENSGRFNFHYLFKKNSTDIQISPDSGTVNQGKKMEIKLTLLPLSKLNLQNHKITMQIISGSTYTFLINAKAKSPEVKFNEYSIDFGPVYVMRQPTPVIRKLQITNKDKEALTIETSFDNKNKPYLDVNLSPGQVILPNDILEVPIVFIPREFMKYRDVIKFNFNGIYEIEVEVKGEGIPLKLELQDPNLQILDFGILLVGQDKKMEFKLVNRGRRDINVLITPENQLNFNKKCLTLYLIETEKEKEKEKVKDTKESVDITKEKEKYKTLTVKPRDIITVGVRFNPNYRIPQFKEDIVYKIDNNETRKLMTVAGASYGVDMKLSENTINCGTVVVNSMTTHRLQMKNLGDLNAKFKWETPSSTKDYSKSFNISPNSGTIPPHEDLFFIITFQPKSVEPNIEFENIKCFVENSETLFLTLRGSCTDIPQDSKMVINIETEVRVQKNFEIKIKNPTNKPWRIQPTISSTIEECASYFIGDQTFEIKEGLEAVYVVKYLPLKMSKPSVGNEKGEHIGTIFFPLPDGNAKLYDIRGIATPPKPKEALSKVVKAREQTLILLNVQNWLYQTQRFKVQLDKEKDDPSVFIKGANTIDIPPNSSKEYKLIFLSWKQLNNNLKVTFTNPVTGEYVFYTIAITVQPADSYQATELIGTVREIVSNSIIIKNPLNFEININQNHITCDNDYVNIKNTYPIKIIPESEIPLEICYRPLLVKEEKANIKISNPDIGDLVYPLVLKGTPIQIQKSLPTINTFLGSEKIETFRFYHYLKKPVDYTVKIEKYSESLPNPIDFIPESAVIKVPAADPVKGVEITGTIKYEPYNIFETKAILKVSSPEGGEYTWILTGQCSPPQPQGPFKVLLNKPYQLEFKNPLNEPAEINVRFDNPNFSCAKINNRIEAKKQISIPITFKPISDQTNTGRITITLNKLPPWTYYLQAE